MPDVMGSAQQPASLPATAYITLWFPKPSETFIYREAQVMRRLGMPLTVHTLYGRLDSH
jgi:hypothetical protein